MTTLNSIHFEIIQHYIKIYLVLYCKGHIQITSNHSTVNVETKNNRVNQFTTVNLIYYIIPHLVTMTY